MREMQAHLARIQMNPIEEMLAKSASIKIRVRTKAPATKINEMLPDGTLKMDVAEIAEDNKANLEIVKFLKKEYGRRYEIIVGHKSKEKILRSIE